MATIIKRVYIYLCVLQCYSWLIYFSCLVISEEEKKENKSFPYLVYFPTLISLEILKKSLKSRIIMSSLLTSSVLPVHPYCFPQSSFQKGLSHCSASCARSHLLGVQKDIQLLECGVSAPRRGGCRPQRDELFL